MMIDELLALLQAKDVALSIAGDELVVRGGKDALDAAFVSLLRENRGALLERLRATGHIDAHSGIVHVPANRIEPGFASIAPEMLPLVNLSQAEIDRVVQTVPGGARNVQDIYPLAPLQEGLLFHHLLDAERDPFVVRIMLRFDSRARVDGFLAALRAVIGRHDILRTSIVWEGLREAAQVVWREAALRVHEAVVDPALGDAVQQLSERCDPRTQRLDVREAPLMRAAVAQDAASGSWVMALLFHHLAVDHTTLYVILEEVQAYLRGEGDTLPVPAPFRNFVAQARLGVSREEHEAFFRELLAGVTEPTAPFGLSDVRTDGTGTDEAHLAVDAGLARRLRSRARALGAGAASVCHLAWACVLAAVSGRDDVVFGTVLFGRMRGGEGSDRATGLFINTLPMRVRIDGEAVQDGVRRTHALLAQLLQHEHASLALAQRCSSIPAPAPLFCAGLNYRHAGRVQSDNPRGWDGIDVIDGGERSTYPCTLAVDDLGDGFTLTAQVHGSVDAARVCDLMHTALENIVVALESAPSTPLCRIGVLSAAERRRMLVEWNATEAPYAADRCVHELFEEQAAKTPAAVALAGDGTQLSYRELNERANRLARYLRSIGVQPDRRVALCTERSLETIVAMLAVLKAGGAYVPLDPAYPSERLRAMLDDSAPVAVLTCGTVPSPVAELLRGTAAPAIDLHADGARWSELPEHDLERGAVTPHDLAYVIYTSGSTGTPKGVMVEHRGVCNLATAQARDFGVDAHSRVLQFASASFDACVSEVVVTLCSGASLCVPAAGTVLAGDALVDVIAQHRITHVTLPPAVLNALPAGVRLESVRTLIVAGEASTDALVKRWSPGRRLINAYGPTESTVCATLHECDPRVDADPPIGRPIDNVRIYLLDERGEPVPAGVPGELHVGGAGVARGYLNRPELTAERFIQSPFVVGDRLYKTGDLARYLPDGTVEFLGRNDFQVKLRGFRVELGEIEACLMRHDAVRDAVVVAREDSVGEKRLVAYYTTSGFGRTVTAEALQQHAQSALPDYMVPAAYVALDALPLTPNGKVDRKALPAAEDTAHVLQAFEAPAGELESAIAAIWCEVLDLARVGRRDDFFDLGGHSLLALRALSRLHEGLAIELDLNTLFDYPVLCDFAREIASATGSAVLPIERAGRDEPLPLSFAQRRLWFLAQMDGGSEAYHIPLGLRLTGELDRLALRRALDRLVARHEMLRTTFTVAGGEPVQRVAPVHGGFLLIEHDLVNDPNAAAGVDALAAQEVRTPFDLAAGPLIRGRLIAIGAAQHVLLITMHHIVSDGWSMGVLMREVSALYRAYRAGEDDPLAPLSIQYADYAAWQRRWLSGEALREQSAYWQQALHDAPALLELPADRPRPKRQDFTGDHVPIDLGPELTAKIKALSQRHGTTLFMTLMTAWGILLSRLSGQSDVVVGTPVANRTRSEVEDLIGFFVNTLALRMDVAPDATVSEMLVRVKALSLHAQAHQDLPFEHVVEIVNPARSLAQSPLFQAMFVWQNNEHGEVVLPGLRIDSLHMPFRTAKFDLTLEVGETHDRITGVLEYATALFDRATAERYAGYLRTLLAAMVDGEDERVDRLTLLPEAERNLMLLEWNATDAPYPSDRRIDALVEAQAAQTPDAVAVVHGTRRMTYAELDERANRFAHYLRGIGVRPGSRVALCMQRSAELVVAELAILKCGAIYIPLDEHAPAERQSFMLADSGVEIVLSLRGQQVARAASVRRIDVDEVTLDGCDAAAHVLERGSDSPAYILYTSGSTGRPKGVVVSHRAIGRLVLNNGFAEFGPSDRFGFGSNPAFDLSTLEVWAPLVTGGCVVVIDREVYLDARALAEAIERENVTALWLTTTLFNEYSFAIPDALGRLRFLIAGGEQNDPQAFARMLRGARKPDHLIHGYGPTEATTLATTLEVTAVPDGTTNLPIGRPIRNTRAYVLNDQLEPMPVGVPGELHIGGLGVAQGYWNRPELTAERFIPSPFVSGDRLYKTGDVARYLPDGTIVFLGRNDFQVKIRGFRVELGEIEARLAQHPSVRDAVVVAREDIPGDKRLAAYYTPNGSAGPAAAEALRAHMVATLPDYMIPAAYVALDALPLNANGKVDRKALPAPNGTAYVSEAYEAPAGDTEIAIGQIWCELLGLERVGRRDDFFKTGGHSLLAVRMLSRVRETLRSELRLDDVFEAPVLADLAALVRPAQRSALPAITPVDRDRPLVASFAQQRMWLSAQIEGVSETYHVPLGWRLSGRLDRAALRRALDRLVARHESLRTAFDVVNGEPVQRIDPAERGFGLLEHDLRGRPGAAAELEELVAREASEAFDLQAGPLVRGRLIALSSDEHVLLITMHHILSDGWSVGVLVRELSALYRAYHDGADDPLVPLPVQYADFAAWQRRSLAGETSLEQSAYWRQTLSGAPALLELPTDRPRPVHQNFAGDHVPVELSASLTAQLRAFSLRHGTTLFMTLLAAWGMLLSRLSGQEDVIVGVPVANRTRTEVEGLIGFFVNTLALRLDFSGDPTVGEVLARVKSRTLQAQAHQDLPFEQVVELVNPDRAAAHTPLFQVTFVWQNGGGGDDRLLAGVRSAPVYTASRFSKFDLTLELGEANDRITGGLLYATALFDRATMTRHAGYLRTLLEGMVAE